MYSPSSIFRGLNTAHHVCIKKLEARRLPNCHRRGLYCVLQLNKDLVLKCSQLPEQYTWQDLKDFVRPEAEHEFWADLTPWPTGSGRKKGCIRTQRWKEAGNLYSKKGQDSIHARFRVERV